MLHINAIVYREADGRFTAEVPSCPGCASWGHTREEAVKNLHEAASLYFEDEDVTEFALTPSQTVERIAL